MPRCWLLAVAVVASLGWFTKLAQADDVSIIPSQDAIEFKVGKEIVGKYSISPSAAKPYLWPVMAPGNVPVTRTWPIQTGAPGDATTDHPHQKSAWFTHGDVIPEGIEIKVKSNEANGRGVDFWSETKDKDGNPRHGTIVCVKVGEPKQISPTHASITTWNEWRTVGGMKIMDEERTLHIHDLGTGRLFTFEITLKATVCPITFGDTKEGSFGVRVHDALRTQLPTGGTVTTADGTEAKAPAKDNLSMWGKPADWHDYSGKVDNKPVGIAIFDDPSNPRAAWHTRGYGLMAANPFGRDKSGFPSQKGKTDLLKIEKGKELKLRYAIYAHSGDAKAGKVAEAYDAFKAAK